MKEERKKKRTYVCVTNVDLFISSVSVLYAINVKFYPGHPVTTLIRVCAHAWYWLYNLDHACVSLSSPCIPIF